MKIAVSSSGEDLDANFTIYNPAGKVVKGKGQTQQIARGFYNAKVTPRTGPIKSIKFNNLHVSLDELNFNLDLNVGVAFNPRCLFQNYFSAHRNLDRVC